MAHDDNVRFGKRLSEKVERREPEPVPQSMGCDVLLEDRSDDRQVGADACQVLVRLSEDDRQCIGAITTLGTNAQSTYTSVGNAVGS
jgi:hypothetical protein